MRERDIYRIITTFNEQITTDPKYARFIPNDEIEKKNGYNLNITRYIDSTDPEDIQDIYAHIHGGIPAVDIDGLSKYWEVFPSLKSELLSTISEKYYSLNVEHESIRQTIYKNTEFSEYGEKLDEAFAAWKAKEYPVLSTLDEDVSARELIVSLAEDIIAEFEHLTLIDKYDAYQVLLAYWNEVMNDDVSLIISESDGYTNARATDNIEEEITQGKNKGEMKVTGWEGRLLPKSIVINAFFRKERNAIEEAESIVAETESQLSDLIESADEESALADVVENGKVKARDIEAKIVELTSTIETEETIELEVIRTDLQLVNTKKRMEAYLVGHPLCKSAVNENGKITKSSIEYRLRIIRTEECVPESLQDDVNQLKEALNLCGKISDYNKVVKELNKALDEKCRARYEKFTDNEILDLLVNKKWFDSIFSGISDLYAEISHRLTSRIIELAERYEDIHIEQLEDGVIAFDVIASCDVEMPSASRKGYFNERWLKIHCQVTLGIDMSGFRIMSVGNCEPQEESDNDRLSGELVPIISREQFEDEAEKFLTRYCPEALEKPMRVPIETIASDMKLQVIEDVPLSDDLTYFGTIIFDNGNVLDKHRKITIRNAKRGTVYLDPRVSYERSVGTKRTTLAHECFHWHRHQPYHVLMKMIGADDNLGKAIQCQIAANSMDSDKWKAVDWMEWQAKGVAPRILMPAKPTRLKADQLLAVYGGADDASIAAYENVIDELAELFDVSRQAAKVRLMDLGYSKAEGAYPFVDGQYARGYSFEAGALDKNQTFTIPYADLFKAYCFGREFKKLIDSGQFVFTDRHLVLNNEKYIARNQAGNATLSEYALTHMDECCVVFSKGYSYQSKYQGAKYYTQFMRNAAPVENQVEYSFELNTHNRTLLDQIQNAKRRSEALRKYPGSFAETLVALQKERKLSNKQLADRSLVGEKTIQRLRNDEEYPTSVQTVLALCVGLKLPLPEAEMFLGKTDFKLNSLKGEGYIYQCVMGACAENSIYEINEMLKENGITPLGSDPDLQ